MRQMSADEIMDQIQGMEDATKKKLLADLLETLSDFRERAPELEGYDFAVKVIQANWPL